MEYEDLLKYIEKARDEPDELLGDCAIRIVWRLADPDEPATHASDLTNSVMDMLQDAGLDIPRQFLMVYQIDFEDLMPTQS